MIQDQNSTIQREVDKNLTEQRRALVSKWVDEIKKDKEHWEKDFKRMRKDMQIAYEGAEEDWVASDRYVVPLAMRHINHAVATLYAKNPTAEAVLRKRLHYKIWDGTVEMLQEAMQNPLDPMNMQMLMEIDQVKNQQRVLKRLGKSLEIVFDYYLNEPEPNFKVQCKQMVRRARVCGVGYLWLSFQRILEENKDVRSRIEDITSKITAIETMGADIQDDKIGDGEATLESLRLNLQDLQKELEIVTREGPVFDFPRSTEIIPERKCTDFKGFIGADYISREFHYSVEEMKEKYKIDVGSQYKAYTPDGETKSELMPSTSKTTDEKKGLVCVWKVYDKKLKQTFTLCDGYPDFLEEPATPKVFIEQFWPCFSLVLNPHEHEKKVVPLSDVYHMRHPQREYNQSRQGLREHRIQNRPVYFTPKGALEESDKIALQSPTSGLVIELNALQQDPDVNKILQKFQPVALDPNLYETKSVMEDIMRSAGSQDANLGVAATSETATGQSIAEHSRETVSSSAADDLDEFLSSFARAVGQICLYELSAQTVQDIAGPGAVWPEMSKDAIAKELYLKVKAGSSGRPNQAADLAKIERAIPYMIQLPGINPLPLAQKYANLLELDPEELIAEGVPSITALNAMAAKAGMAQPGGADPRTSPEMQGDKGALNAPNPQERQEGPQPAMPAPDSSLPHVNVA